MTLLLRITPYLLRMRENTDQKNTDYGHFAHGESFSNLREIFRMWFLCHVVLSLDCIAVCPGL